MKKLFLKMVLIFGLIFTYGLSYGQATLENCPKKGTADCPLIKNCSKKGTADCPYTQANNEIASAEHQKASEELADCPFAGTPDCPLIKNCPKKGTTDCPYTKAANETTASSDTKVNDEDLPACCRKKNKK